MRKFLIILLLGIGESNVIAGGFDSSSVGRPPVDPSILKAATCTGLSAVMAPLEGKTIYCTTKSGPMTGNRTLYWGAAKVVGGKLYTKAYTGIYSIYRGNPSSPWTLGKTASMSYGSYHVKIITDATGLTAWANSVATSAPCGDPTLCSTTTSTWAMGCTTSWPNT